MSENKNVNISDEQASVLLNGCVGQAEKMLKNEDKMERFLQRLEKKLKVIPLAGEKLAVVPVFASLIKSYVKKDYTDIPIGSVLAILGALIYFVSPIDLIPDGVPVVGYADDAAVIALCWKLVEADVEEYKKWRENNGKVMEDI